MTSFEKSKPDLIVAAVMATMNRSATALSCVKALAQQTRALDLVVVADNASTDTTVTDLRELAPLPFELIIHEMGKNRGNAGGVEEAMNQAFSRGADAVWVLDDDSWPQPEALQHLVAGEWNPEVVRHAIQIDPLTKLMTWPLPLDHGTPLGWRLVWKPEDLPESEFMKTRASWTGALISRLIYDTVGPVNGDLFIRGEDEEYPWRIEKAGFSFEAVKSAVMDHPGPKGLIHWKFFGRNLFIERGLPDSKLYYKVRNMVWLKKKQAGSREAALMAAAYLGGVIITDGPARFPILCRAIRDGWKNVLGIMPG